MRDLFLKLRDEGAAERANDLTRIRDVTSAAFVNALTAADLAHFTEAMKPTTPTKPTTASDAGASHTVAASPTRTPQ